ncbi:MAG TPA: hypothetical protein DDX40_02220 [Rikenellaceae bacterium]|nr:hypothetical protein [Rikenellaceae bacterium]
MKIKIALTVLTLLPAHSLPAAPDADSTQTYSLVRKVDTSALAKAFQTPPKEARPQVWWHWMDGNVSKVGIRKDIEWMKRNGIGGFHQFDAGGVNMPRAAKVKLPYLSDGWKDAFRFALDLADSLDMDVTIASAPGWSSTGGTWVKPDDAIKKLEWRSIDTRGGKISVQLPELYSVVGPYQDYRIDNDRIQIKPHGKDLYVLAVRLPYSDKSMNALGAQICKSESTISVEFRRPQTIKALTLKSMAMGDRPRSGKPECRNILECSDDGIKWRKVCDIEPTVLPYLTLNIPPTCAQYFRVKGEKLESLELHTVTKINHSQELGGFGIIHDFWKYRTPYSKDAIRTSDIIDLTGKMTADGKLECTLPAGRWRIFRFGWSITGKVNHPASPEATGLEVDKLDPDAWMKYFRTYLDLYKEAAGGMLGERGIRYLLVDSYEAGACTWTPKMAEEFKARRGYDLLPWLPVLTGEIIGSSQMSERFLWDWRRTIGELFCENYDRINDIVKEYDLAGRYTESHEGGRAYTGDGMDPKIKATIPMAAFWMENTPTGSSVPSAICDIRESASVSHIYGQQLVAAESFSVNGDEGRAYTYCPENMKYITDVGLSAGVNRFVIHESASQPNDKYLPGLQLFRYGQWLHRNETWGEYAWVLTDYLARSSLMLQHGTSVADILLYYGEDLNITGLYGGEAFSTLPQVPDGYNYDFANPTVLRSGVKAENGTLVAPSGARYRFLWLDRNCEVMSLDILKKIKEFADAGVIICGKEPKQCAGLKADDRTFASIVDDVWHSRRKNVFTNGIGDCLKRSGIEPDFRVMVAEPVEATSQGGSGHFDKLSDRDKALSERKMPKRDQEDAVEAPANAPDIYGDFRYVHRTLPDSTQIYWVRNFSGKDSSVKLSFRDGGKFAAIFNPENGEISDAEVDFSDGRSTVSLPLLASDARFVVLSGKPQVKVTVDTVFVNDPDSVMVNASDSIVICRGDSIGNAGHFDRLSDRKGELSDRKLSDAEPVVRHGSPAIEASVLAKTEMARQTPNFAVIQSVNTIWQVHFDQKNGGTADEEFSELESWTKKENPIVKYFSGTAVYKTTIAVDSTTLADNTKIFMDLGVVKNIADISINGTPAGVLWKAPFRTTDIKPLLKEGDNILEIKVTNVWRNRMIGDVQPGEKNPVTAIRRFYKASDKLLPSGLLGPVRLLGL